MLTKERLKLIRSLASRKGRRASGLFVAEGPKLVGDLLGAIECTYLLASQSWQQENVGLWNRYLLQAAGIAPDVVRDADFERASLQQSPQGVLALFRIPSFDVNPSAALEARLNIVLDDVQDPGNLGTIVRLADWFGVDDVWCSQATADIWNPKAVQATMGALARVRVHYINIYDMLSALPADIPCFATALDGEPLWGAALSHRGAIVMGNEGRGVSPAVQALCRRRLLIPSFPSGRQTTDSLNVAMATGIVLAEFRRQHSVQA